MSNRPIDNITFQNTVTSVGNGVECFISSGSSTLNIETTGTATSSTLVFEGKTNNIWCPIMCVNLSTLNLATQTTGLNEIWQVELSGLSYFRVRVSSISGGNVTVLGRVVD